VTDAQTIALYKASFNEAHVTDSKFLVTSLQVPESHLQAYPSDAKHPI
jgi:hypothetical protein